MILRIARQPASLAVYMSIIVLILVMMTSIHAQQLIPLPNLNMRAITELLTNPSFEADLDADKIPDDWEGIGSSVIAADKQKCNKAEKPVAHTGSCAFQFKGNADGSKSTLTQTIGDTSLITNGTLLTFSVYLDPRSAAPGITFGKAQLKFSDGSKQKFALRIPDAARAVEDYRLVSDTQPVSIPIGSSITTAKVKFTYNQVSGKFLIDDASFGLGSPDPTPTLTLNVTDTPSASLTLTATAPATNTPTETASATVTLTNTPVATVTFTPTYTNTAQAQFEALVADDGGAGDQFGAAVALNTNGNTALIGAPGSLSGAGAAYLFTYSNFNWAQQKLSISDSAAADRAGTSVALSDDGTTALVGAPFHDAAGGNEDQGAVYVFQYDGVVWTQQQKLFDAVEGYATDLFGQSVALSSDGNLAVIGASGVYGQGAVYIFTRTAGIWTQQQKLLANDGAFGDSFGHSVALSSDGSTVLVGAQLQPQTEPEALSGAAYVFVRTGDVWLQQQKLKASDATAGDLFGNSVSLSGSGDTALIGTFKAFEAVPRSGVAYTFIRSAGVWTQQQTLMADAVVNEDGFGFAVALNADGDRALIGAVLDTIDGNAQQGSAFNFYLSSGEWRQYKKMTPFDGQPQAFFGASVAIGLTAGFGLVGAPLTNVNTNNDQGVVYSVLVD
ncbi:MAG: FG-GAP repeat protein [Armatimonadetes bacterium]|nr:FG-GAP repeat protein [Anaerolineae bacterium]